MSAGSDFATTRPLFLTGMPGAGKSTVGRVLAAILAYDFVDLDDEVEQRAGRPIAELMRESEPAFRALERETLASVGLRERVVVATGGGALVDPAAMQLARSRGTVVYLRSDTGVLVDRLGGAPVRPLLRDADGNPLSAVTLAERLEGLLAAREPAYMTADVVVEAGAGAPDEVAFEIARRIRARG